MSVVPLRPDAPEPAPPASPAEADGWALLDALRRKLDDQGAQGRRTHDQVQQLAESLAALVAAQRRRSRWLNLNSFIAYVLFTVLCGTAMYALYARRAGELADERDKAVVDRDASARQVETLTASLRERDERLAAGARVKEAEPPPVDPDAPYKAAVAAFKAGRYPDARGPFEAALAAEPTGKRAPTLHYYLGVIDAKDGKLPPAIAHFQAALAGDVAEDDARFQLASAFDRAGDFPHAKAEYDQFATAHPKMQLAVYAQRRSAVLARIVQPQPAAPPTPAPAAPAATPPAAPPAPAPSPDPTP